MSNGWNWALVVIGALLVLVEVALGGFAGFDLVLIGSSFLLGGGIGMLVGSAPVGFVIAAVLCLAYVAIGRRWVRSRMQHGDVQSNADALVGRTAMVTVRVAPHEAGQVKLGGEVWRALPAEDAAGPFEPGAEVTIRRVDGVTLLVR